MDFMNDAIADFESMKENQIAMKKSPFYQAYALNFEMMKKFEASENMYHNEEVSYLPVFCDFLSPWDCNLLTSSVKLHLLAIQENFIFNGLAKSIQFGN